MRAVAAKQALEALGTEKQAELTKHSAPLNDGQMWENTHTHTHTRLEMDQ